MSYDYRTGPEGTGPATSSSPGQGPGKQTLVQAAPTKPAAGQDDPVLKQVEKYNTYIQEAASKYGMDPEHLKAIMAVESRGNPNASSGAAFGLMQVTKGTWEGTRKQEPDLAQYEFEANWRDPRINTLFGAAVLKSKSKSMGVTPDDENFAALAVIAYNAGEGTVKHAINHAKAAGSKNPSEDFLKPEHLKPAIDKYGLYSYYLTNATGKKRNKSGTKEEAIDLKYKEIIRYVPQVEGYLAKLGDSPNQPNTPKTQKDGGQDDGATPIGDKTPTPTNGRNGEGPDDDAAEQGNAPPDQDTSPNAQGRGPSGERTYQVRSGDTLSEIAQQFLGSSGRWREIAQHNGVTNPRALRVGQTLRIPGTTAGAGAGAGTTTDQPSAPTGEGSTPTPAQAVVEYRVRSGDTLAEIAERLLGSADRWQEIANANGISDPRALRIGQVLRVTGGNPQAAQGDGQRQGNGQRQGDAEQDDAETDGGGGGGGGKPSWLSVAESEVGTKEVKGSRHNPRVIEYHAATSGKFSNDETAWCSSFVNWVMKQSGQSGTNNAMALSWKSYGTKLARPAYGCIAVFSWGGGKGHVGFVVGKQGGSLLILGGNQSNAVNVTAFATDQIVAYVVPSGYTVPASAYQLGGSSTRVRDNSGVSATR